MLTESKYTKPGIKERQPLLLKSTNLHSFLSWRRTYYRLLAGDIDDSNLQELEVCLVTADEGCTTKITATSKCIDEDKDYRNRAHGSPIVRYLVRTSMVMIKL
ncbi:hypothetical protein BGZ82_008097 [Podila clonocystis]|nr:hypothetical protein BGZ82_008097 [Podila clonocystis]